MYRHSDSNTYVVIQVISGTTSIMYSKRIPCLSCDLDISYRHDIISFCSLLYVLSFLLLFFQVPLEIRIPILLSADQWIRTLEQILLLILIVGRWLLPKGKLTHDQLSQLLLVYIGTAADIVEFFEAFKEEEVIRFI